MSVKPQWIASPGRGVVWTCSVCGHPIPQDAPMEYRVPGKREAPSRHDREDKFPAALIVRHLGTIACEGWAVAPFPHPGRGL